MGVATLDNSIDTDRPLRLKAQRRDNASSVRVLVGDCLGSGSIGVAFSKVKRDFIERTLFPLFGLCQPETFALGIQRRPLPADQFLVANFNELVHERHSRNKRRRLGANRSGVETDVSIFGVEVFLSYDVGSYRSAILQIIAGLPQKEIISGPAENILTAFSVSIESKRGFGFLI